MIILRGLSKEQKVKMQKVQCVVEWMIAVLLQRVALDFHTASSFSLVVQEDCGNDLEEKEASAVA